MKKAYGLLHSLKQDPRNLVRVVGNINDDIAFAITNENNKRKITKVRSRATDVD